MGTLTGAQPWCTVCYDTLLSSQHELFQYYKSCYVRSDLASDSKGTRAERWTWQTWPQFFLPYCPVLTILKMWLVCRRGRDKVVLLSSCTSHIFSSCRTRSISLYCSKLTHVTQNRNPNKHQPTLEAMEFTHSDGRKGKRTKLKKTVRRTITVCLMNAASVRLACEIGLSHRLHSKS